MQGKSGRGSSGKCKPAWRKRNSSRTFHPVGSICNTGVVFGGEKTLDLSQVEQALKKAKQQPTTQASTQVETKAPETKGAVEKTAKELESQGAGVVRVNPETCPYCESDPCICDDEDYGEAEAGQEVDEGPHGEVEQKGEPGKPETWISVGQLNDIRTQRIERKHKNVSVIELAMREETEIPFPENVELKQRAEASTIDLSTYRNVVNAIGLIQEEAVFTSTPEGTMYRAMDPSHVMLVDIQIPPEACEKYESNGLRKWCIRTDDMAKIRARAEKNERVEFHVSEDAGKMKISLVGRRRREYENPLIESSMSDCPLPKLTFDAMFVVAKKEFENVLKDIAVKSNHVNIEAEKGVVFFSGKGDLGKASTSLKKDELCVLEVQKESKSTYSLEYIQKLLKAVDCESVKLEYSSQTPLRIEMQIGLDPECRIHYYLAPRVQE